MTSLLVGRQTRVHLLAPFKDVELSFKVSHLFHFIYFLKNLLIYLLIFSLISIITFLLSFLCFYVNCKFSNRAIITQNPNRIAVDLQWLEH